MKRSVSVRSAAVTLCLSIIVWGALAYAVLAFGWRHYEHERGLDGREMITRTSQGIAGDPINMGFVGEKADIVCAFHAAGWYPANPVTLVSSLKIIGSVVLHRPYLGAPVSPLFYDGREEDLAFQLPAGQSADTRHHIRLWKVLTSGQSSKPVWLGAATFDRGVGFNHYTLQVTHHIAADIDAERQFIANALKDVGAVKTIFKISGIGPTLNGRNGGGDRYFTDGEVIMQSLVSDCKLQPGLVPATLPDTPLVNIKNGLWEWLRPLM
jgi:hypothetical protein